MTQVVGVPIAGATTVEVADIVREVSPRRSARSDKPSSAAAVYTYVIFDHTLQSFREITCPEPVVRRLVIVAKGGALPDRRDFGPEPDWDTPMPAGIVEDVEDATD